MISQSFYNNKYLKKVFDLDIINIKLVESKIKQYTGFTPMTKDELIVAVKMWYSNEWYSDEVDNEAILLKYGCISNWNVQNINDMSRIFHGYEYFNEPLNNWNVSNVTNMNFMFYKCEKFNQPINNWNVSSDTRMVGMFSHCKMKNPFK